jgi:hypothetical protein
LGRLEPRVLFFHATNLGKGFLPLSLQSPSYQPILGLDRIVLPLRPVRLKPGTLNSLAPLRVLSRPVSFNSLMGLETQFQSCRFQGLQHQVPDQGVQ